MRSTPIYEVSNDEFVEHLVGLWLDHVELRQGYLDVHPEAPTPRELRELAGTRDLSFTFHAPFRGANLANLNEQLRQATVAGVKQSLDTALAAGAGGVVVVLGSGYDYLAAHRTLLSEEEAA